jgi:hypothetical protein
LKDFNLRFLNSSDNKSIPFLPYGVTTIEFAIEGAGKAGYIRPAYSTLDDYEKKEYVGFAKDNKDFLVVWGAGEGKGQHVQENSTDRMFMQLIHLRGNYPEAIITLEHTGLFDKEELKIHKPENGPDMAEVFKMVTKVNKSELKTTRLEGTYMPMYYSRWFPPKRIDYVSPAVYPLIQIEYREDDSGVYSPIDIFLEANGHTRRICTIDGDLRYSRLHAELFALFENKSIFVLRLWLYWIHKRYLGGLLGDSGSSSPENGKSELGAIDRVTGLEIPDIERFDFVINLENSKIILYGTDIHYQEYWGKVKDPFVKAKIAGNVDLFIMTARLVPLRFLQDSDYYNPIESVKAYILEENKEREFRQLVVDQEKPEELEKLGVNLRAHVPYVDEGMIGGKSFLSSDSRRGAKKQ